LPQPARLVVRHSFQAAYSTIGLFFFPAHALELFLEPDDIVALLVLGIRRGQNPLRLDELFLELLHPHQGSMLLVRDPLLGMSEIYLLALEIVHIKLPELDAHLDSL